MLLRRTSVIALVAVTVAALTSCQGGGTPAPDAAVAAADQVCRAAQRDLDDIATPTDDPDSVAKWSAAVAKRVRREVADLRALRPAGSGVTGAANGLGAVAGLIDDVGAAADRGADVSAELEAVRKKTVAVGAQARDDGFAACGRPLVLPPPGDEESTDTTSGDSSGDGAFATAADNRCSQAYLAFEGLPDPTDEQSMNTFLNDAYDIVDGLGLDLSALEAPDGARETFQEMLASLALDAKAILDARQAHGQGDVQTRDDLIVKAAEHQDDFGTKAKVIALDSCARFAR